MTDISADRVTQLAAENWAGEERAAYSADLVSRLYREELGGGGERPPSQRRVQVLELSQYLENYLWPHYAEGAAGPAAYEHLMSMVALVNQKFREQVPGWACFQQHNQVRWGRQAAAECGRWRRLKEPSGGGGAGCGHFKLLRLLAPCCVASRPGAAAELAPSTPGPLQEAFPAFFQRVLALQAEAGERMRMHERVSYLLFTINAFQVLTGGEGVGSSAPFASLLGCACDNAAAGLGDFPVSCPCNPAWACGLHASS
jgi:hypothetical protein